MKWDYPQHKTPYLTEHEMRFVLCLVQMGACVWCGGMMSLTRKKNGQPARDFATFEHITRKQDGGKMNLTNLVLACAKCNRKRERVADWIGHD